MKKLFFVMAAVAALLTSCSKDDTFGGPTRGKVTFEVSTPELATRYGEGTTATNLQYAVYDMIENQTIGALVHTGSKQFETGSLTTSVTIDLVEGRKYEVVFWADAGANSPYVFNTDANQKSVSYKDGVSLTANNENYDAFFAYYGDDNDENVNVGQVVKVTLKRPFAQLNVATSDAETAKELGVEVKATGIKVDAYTSFNLQTGAVSDKEELTFAMTEVDDAATTATEYNIGTITANSKNYDWLTMNYILVNERETTDVTFLFEDTKGKADYERPYSSINVQRNHRTNIIGAILTDPTQFDVTIDKVFTTPDINEERGNSRLVSDAQSLQEAINDPDVDVIVFDGHIDLNDLGSLIIYDNSAALSTTTRADESYGLLIPAGKTLTLDLNGFTISQEKAQTTAYNMIQNQGTLTIMDSSANGDGKISYKDAGNGDEYVSNAIQNSGTLTIEAGTIENNSVANVATNGYPHPIDNSGKLIINGGTINNNANYSSMRIWCTTDDDTEVTINGGTFYGSIDFQTVNKSANKGTLTINGGQFNADEHCGAAVRLLGFGTDVDEMNGYINGGEFNGVIKLGKYVDGEFNSQVFHISGGTFSDASVFKYLSKSAEEINITMAADMTLDGGTSLNYGGENLKKLTINGDDHKLTYKDSYRTYINLANANATLVLNDMQMFRETSNTNTHWHNNNMKFENNTEMNNVTFNKGITLDDAKTFKLNNVTITKNAVSTYAMFITAGCDVTIDGMTINHADGVKGRGIKIVDEDVTNKDAQTKLNISNAKFTTAEKAAVLVGSKGGAVINWGEGNDISKVAADKEFAVWVDEDYAAHADKVVVNGAYVKVEGEKVDDVVEVGTAEDLKAALNNLMAGNEVVLTKDIDLTGVEWAVTAPWQGSTTEVVFDGGGHKITGLTTNGLQGGLLGKFNSNGKITIKNLILENVTITGTDVDGESAGGALIGWIENHGGQTITIENVKVNGIKAEGFKYIGGLIGYNNGNVEMNLTGCSVTGATDSYLNSTYNESGNYKGHVGGLLGLWMNGELTNCEVKNIAIKHGTTDMTGSSNRAGALVGTKYSGVTVTSATVENVTVDGVAATTASLFGPNASQVSDTDKSNVTIK